MDLIIHQVVKFHHIDVTDRHRTLERVAGPTVIDHRLAVFRQTRLFQINP